MRPADLETRAVGMHPGDDALLTIPENFQLLSFAVRRGRGNAHFREWLGALC